MVQRVRLLERLEAAQPKVRLFGLFFPEAEGADADQAMARLLAGK